MSTFVLVDGAWHGGWCWRRVEDRLVARGHRVFAPTLTGLADRSHVAAASVDLTTHIADIVNLLRWERLTDVVLCGHSYGGMVISGVAEAASDSIASLVFLDAFLPDDGDSIASLRPDIGEHAKKLAAEGATGIPPIPAAAFKVNEADREFVDAQCTPQPLGCMTQSVRLTDAHSRIAKKTFIRAEGYPSEAFDAAKAKCQTDPAWTVLGLVCGHDAMLDMPDALADLLIAAA